MVFSSLENTHLTINELKHLQLNELTSFNEIEDEDSKNKYCFYCNTFNSVTFRGKCDYCLILDEKRKLKKKQQQRAYYINKKRGEFQKIMRYE